MALMLLTAALCACTRPAADVKEESPVAVQLGDRTITLADVQAKYDSTLSMYTSYGYPEPNTSRAVEKLQDEVVKELLNRLMLLHQADLAGIGTLTDEQASIVRQTTDEQMEALIDIYIQRAKTAGTSATRKAAIRTLEQTMADAGMGMSWDEYGQYLYDELYKDRVISNLQALVTRDVAVTEAEIAAYYDETLAAQQTAFDASASDCVDALVYFAKFGGKPVLYVPEGLVFVRILTVEGVSMKAQRTIEQAYAELQNGASFASVLLSYGEDDDYTKYPSFVSDGVPFLPEGTDDAFDTRIYDAVKTLAAGAYSEPLILDEQCVIVNVAGSIPSGARTLEQAADAVSAAVLADKKETVWNEQKTAWCSDFSEAVYYEDVYRGVGK